MTHPNKPLTPRVVIHHQNAKWAQTKKRCTLKKEILIFGYVKNYPKWSQKLANLLQKLKILQKITIMFAYMCKK